MNDSSKERLYQVPRRFGMRTVLAATAGFALMLGIVKWLGVSPVVVIFYTSFIMVVSAAQIAFESKPRLASMVAGGLFLPLLKLGAMCFDHGLAAINHGPFTGLFSGGQFFYLCVFGALYGYLIGTMLAGIYLVADKLKALIALGFKHQLPTGA